jgi:hypothetical protein
MGRVLFTIIIPLVLPTVVYILWRTFAPLRFGGSEAIHNNDWEPLPWLHLSLVGAVLVTVTMGYIALAPGAEMAPRSGPAAATSGEAPPGNH